MIKNTTNPLATSLIQSVRGLDGATPSQAGALTRAMDVDGDGAISYLAEFGGASSYVAHNYTTTSPCGPRQLAPNTSVDAVVAGLEARKASIAAIADQFVDMSFEEARRSGASARYFGGFFDASVRTLKDEVRDVAHKLRNPGQLDELKAIVAEMPRDAAGKITFETWDTQLFPRLQADLGAKPQPRLLHGAQWGDL